MNFYAFLANQGHPMKKDPKMCEHWEMAFCVMNETVFTKCLSCKTVAGVKLDGNFVFTTMGVRRILSKVNEDTDSNRHQLGMD